MLQVTLKKIGNACDSARGGYRLWCLPPLCGLLYALAYPPFNSTLHPAFTSMPFLSFLSMIPLFFFATREPRRHALIGSYLYCAAMMLGQSYWIGFVTMEGFWALVILGVALITVVWGAYYFLAALALRFLSQRIPRLYIAVFPAIWVLIEYFRTLTDIAFPWALAGYGSVGILPIAQFSSFTGVWGLSYLIVLGNIVIWELLRAIKNKDDLQRKWVAFGAWAALTVGIFVWGLFRMGSAPEVCEHCGPGAKIALMQSYMDQFNWERNSLDTAITVSDSMIKVAVAENPDALIFPESALLCYLERRPDVKHTVQYWSRAFGIPIVLGGLHWEHSQVVKGEHDVYNTAFLIKDGNISRYNKILLVPFSEIMPFEMQFPILSRVNLGGAGFKRGDDEAVFRISDRLEAAPYVCYEIIFPSFVRRRLTGSTNLLVNITNDGWFGRTSGPYQHAAMSQMRSIENGITLARSANSGISMFVDPYGRIIAKTGLYTREILTRDIPTYRVMTFYSRYGDWFVTGCAILVAIGVIACFIGKRRVGEITNPLLIDEQKFAAVNR